MLTVERPVDLVAYVGKKLGTSDWVLVDQERIDKFAAATLDEAWFHVDPERSARDMPGGRTIAHGFLTLSLFAHMTETIYAIRRQRRGVNYGLNRLRFPAPVPEGMSVGTLKVWRNDNLVLEAPLKTSAGVGKGNISQRAFDAVTELMIGLFRAGAERL